MTAEKRFFLQCNCFSHGIMVSWFDDEKLLYMSSWSMNPYNKAYWKEQLRHIWYIITKGHPFEDNLVLNLSDAKLLKDKLNEFIEEVEWS